jgi:hypothetical protein
VRRLQLAALKKGRLPLQSEEPEEVAQATLLNDDLEEILGFTVEAAAGTIRDTYSWDISLSARAAAGGLQEEEGLLRWEAKQHLCEATGLALGAFGD